MAGARVLNWNGKDLPEELRDLPAGRYVVEAVEPGTELTAEEEAGLEQALASIRAGNTRSSEQVRQALDSLLKK